MTSLIANYTTKPIDIVCFQGAKLAEKQTLQQKLFCENNAGEVCVGIQKLIQRWLLNFLTVRGSVKFNENKGTNFLLDALSAYSYSDVEDYFNLARLMANDQTRVEETEDMPAEERLDHVELLGIEYKSDHFLIKIKMISKYGNSSPVVIPINTNPIPL